MHAQIFPRKNETSISKHTKLTQRQHKIRVFKSQARKIENKMQKMTWILIWTWKMALQYGVMSAMWKFFCSNFNLMIIKMKMIDYAHEIPIEVKMSLIVKVLLKNFDNSIHTVRSTDIWPQLCTYVHISMICLRSVKVKCFVFILSFTWYLNNNNIWCLFIFAILFMSMQITYCVRLVQFYVHTCNISSIIVCMSLCPFF